MIVAGPTGTERARIQVESWIDGFGWLNALLESRRKDRLFDYLILNNS